MRNHPGGGHAHDLVVAFERALELDEHPLGDD